MNAEDVLNFWFHEISPEKHWAKDPLFDEEVRMRFGNLLKEAERGELFRWRGDARGRLAEIIVLDQFSRNIYRGDKKAFKNDCMALILAEELIILGLDQKLSTEEKAFAYMPFMHSESLHIHEQAMKLFSFKGLEDNLKFEIEHRNIILRFGRYPHRNEVLGRASTPEELTFMQNHHGF